MTDPGTVSDERARLSALTLVALQALAAERGLPTSRRRKGELVDMLSDSDTPTENTESTAPGTDSGSEADAGIEAGSTPEPEAPAAESAEASADQPLDVAQPDNAEVPPVAEEAPVEAAPAPRRRSRRASATTADAAELAATVRSIEVTDGPSPAPETAPDAPAEEGTAPTEPAAGDQAGEQTSDPAGETSGDGSAESGEAGEQAPASGRSRSRNRNRNKNRQGGDQTDGGEQQPAQSAPQQNGQQNGGQQNGGQQNGGQNGPQQDGQEGAGESRRSRYRDRKRGRGGQSDLDEPELSDDDVLIPIAGILDVLDNYAFVRTSGYLSGPNDVYVSLGQVKRYHLRKGDAVVGAIRQPREGESQSGRQKYNAIVKVDSVNGQPLDTLEDRVEFDALTPVYPTERLRLETTPDRLSTRLIDLVAPIGKGQRGLIVAPPTAGKTLILKAIAQAVATNNPETHIMVVLVDERPEEVTDMQRSVKGEVIASTFDRPAEDHTTVAELAIERAKRLVELGTDVVVLVDSITRLGRAYNLAQPPSGRTLSGGVDAAALHPTKRFFGAARNIEGGGSLTILATAPVETGSTVEEVIFEEFQGTGNSELRLSRELADSRIFPAIDILASSTRREEELLSPEEVRITWGLRRALAGEGVQQQLERVLGELKDTSSNTEFLVRMQKTLGAS